MVRLKPWLSYFNQLPFEVSQQETAYGLPRCVSTLVRIKMVYQAIGI